MARALNRIGAYAEERGVVLATETGPEPGHVLGGLIESLTTRGIRVNFDPANFIMLGFDHMAALDALHPYIVHTHAKDGLPGGPRCPWGRAKSTLGPMWPSCVAMAMTATISSSARRGVDPIGDVREGLAFLRTL